MEGDDVFKDFQGEYIASLVGSLNSIDADKLEAVCNKLIEAHKEGRTVFLIGNGGSSSTPSHTAGDWAKVLRIRSLCLTDNTPFVTATSNDEEYDEIFRDQLRVYMRPGDVLIGYSGSGNSENVIRAVEFARENGGFTIGMTGNYKGGKGGRLAKTADIALVVENESMEHIEDIHLVINHIIKEYLRKHLVMETGS